MIYSKANLVAVDIVKSDKSIPALDNLHLRADGGTIAANGSCIIAVSPVNETERAKVPLTSSSMIDEAETVSSETVREVLRGMPRDTLFAGTLEHCDYSGGRFTLTDGKRSRSISARTYPREYIDYRAIFKRTGKTCEVHKIAINLRRLTDVLNTLDKMFPDSSKNLPVYLSFTDDDSVCIRCADVYGRQRALCVMRSYSGVEGKWLIPNEWEKKLCDSPADTSTSAARKINKKKRTA